MNDSIYKPNAKTFIFGSKIGSIISLSVLKVNEEWYLNNFKKRLSSFTTSLINNTEFDVTFDYRIVVSPQNDHYSYGTCEFYLLCKLENSNSQNAKTFQKGLDILFSTTFQEYEICPIQSEDIKKILNKFPIKQLYQITRRFTKESLHSLVGKRDSIGFIPNKIISSRKNISTIDYIFPFLYYIKHLHHLLILLLKQNSGIVISCRFSPTVITDIEEQFLEKQISICERFGEFGSKDFPDDISSVQTTLQEQAKVYQQHLTKNLYGMLDNCCVMVLEIAVQKKVSHFIIDSIGSLITEPAGTEINRTLNELSNYLAGGFHVNDLGNSQSSINAFKSMSIKTPKLQNITNKCKRIPYLYDTYQAISLLRLPPTSVDSLPGINNKLWVSRPAPNTIDDNGVLIGNNKLNGKNHYIRIGQEERFKHTYIVGQTGTGKSTMLQTMVLNDINNNQGVCVIDPHGDLYNDILEYIPKDRIKDVILIDPTDENYPIGMNLLECSEEKQKHFIIQGFTEIIRRLTEDEFEDGGSYIGPMFIQHLRMNLLLIMSDKKKPGTLIDLYSIFFEKDYWKKWLPLKVKDPLLTQWVEHTLPGVDYVKSGYDGYSMGGYVGSKFQGFVFDPIMRNIFSQRKSTIDFAKIMNQGKIVLINLAKGALSDANSRLLGMIVLAKIQAAAMSRTKLLKKDRIPFHIYVDEFQNIATQNFISMLSEARKYNVSLVLANQFLSQLKNTRITKAIFGNVGTIISFRLGQEDAQIMKTEMGDVFSIADLTNFPNWHASVSTIISGEAIHPFTIQTIPTNGKKKNFVKEIRRNSRKHYSVKL